MNSWIPVKYHNNIFAHAFFYTEFRSVNTRSKTYMKIIYILFPYLHLIINYLFEHGMHISTARSALFCINTTAVFDWSEIILRNVGPPCTGR